MNKTLSDFAKFNITAEALRNALGKDIYHINHVVPETIFAKDVKNAIEKYLSGSVSKEDLTEWVNIVWFTELFQYSETEEDSIASVITALETLDEDNVEFTIGDFDTMIKALENNTEYECGKPINMENKNMKNDWRLTNQINYLSGKTLIQVPYTPYSKTWTHDHCEFCSETIDETTKDAYCTEDKYHWICKDCFKDFKEMFDWRIKEIN